MDALVGRQSLTVETDDNSGCWFGQIRFPKAKHKSAIFELSRYGEPYRTEPFQIVGDHTGTLVNCWVNLNRPISLIEPFATLSGAGAWSANFRSTARTKGQAGTFVENAHLEGTEDEVSAIGFSSDTLTELSRYQASDYGAEKLDKNPLFTKQLTTESEVPALGTLKFVIRYGKNEWGLEEIKSAYLHLSVGDGCSIWTARKWARFQVAFVDYLAGQNSGDFFHSLYLHGEDQFRLRMSFPKRKKKDYFGAQSAKLTNAAITLPSLMVEAWCSEELKRRVFVASSLVCLKLGLLERFARSIAFLEQWLGARYGSADLLGMQGDYRAGISEFNQAIQNLPDEQREFASRFAGPRFPNGLGLRNIIELALQECRPLGLNLPDTYASELVSLRNSIVHNGEGEGENWHQAVMCGSDACLAIIELLTAKDLGLNPGSDFIPRSDRYGTQNGIYSSP